MARCAVVQYSDDLVVNLIIADPNVDPGPFGCFLVDIDDKPYVDIGWYYDPANDDFYPPPSGPA